MTLMPGGVTFFKGRGREAYIAKLRLTPQWEEWNILIRKWDKTAQNWRDTIAKANSGLIEEAALNATLSKAIKLLINPDPRRLVIFKILNEDLTYPITIGLKTAFQPAKNPADATRLCNYYETAGNHQFGLHELYKFAFTEPVVEKMFSEHYTSLSITKTA